MVNSQFTPPSFQSSRVALLKAVATIYQQSGYRIENLEDSGNELIFLARSPADDLPILVAWWEMESTDASPQVALQGIAQRVGCPAHSRVHVVGHGPFPPEVAAVAASLGMELSDAAAVARATAPQPLPAPPVSAPAPMQVPAHHAVPPPLPSPSVYQPAIATALPPSPAPRSAGRALVHAFLKGIAGLAALGILLVMASFAYRSFTQVPKIEEPVLSKEAEEKLGHLPLQDARLQTLAAKYVAAAKQARQADIHLADEENGDVARIVDRLTTGVRVTDPESPHFNKFIGVPNVPAADRKEMPRYLQVHLGDLLPASRVAGTPLLRNWGRHQEEPQTSPQPPPAGSSPPAAPVVAVSASAASSPPPPPQGLAFPPKLPPGAFPAAKPAAVPAQNTSTPAGDLSWTALLGNATAATWRSKGNPAKLNAFYRDLWKLDSLPSNFRFHGFAKDMLELKTQEKVFVSSEELPSESALREAVRKYPHFAYATMGVFNQETRSNIMPSLLGQADRLGPIPCFHLRCREAMDDGAVTSPEKTGPARAALQKMLAAEQGLSRFPDIVAEEIVFNPYTRDFFLSHHGLVAREFAASPRVPAWLNDLVQGRHLYLEAFDMRKRAEEGKVPPKASRAATLEHFDQAKTALLRSAKANPHHPAPVVELMRVYCAGEQGREAASVNLCFKRSLSIELDHEDAYRLYFQALQTRFGGEQRTAEAGRACLASGRFDTRIPGYLLLSHHIRAEDAPSFQAYWKARSAEEMADLERLVVGYESSPNRDNWFPYFLSATAAVHYHRDDKERLVAALKRLDFKIDQTVLSELKIDPREFDLRLEALKKQYGLRGPK